MLLIPRNLLLFLFHPIYATRNGFNNEIHAPDSQYLFLAVLLSWILDLCLFQLLAYFSWTYHVCLKVQFVQVHDLPPCSNMTTAGFTCPVAYYLWMGSLLTLYFHSEHSIITLTFPFPAPCTELPGRMRSLVWPLDRQRPGISAQARLPGGVAGFYSCLA